MRNILKQSFYLFLSQAITRTISFFYIIYLAKTLGVFDFGLFTVALAYFSIISSFADFGFNRFLIREVAKDKLSASKLLWAIVLLRLTLTSVLFASFALILYLIDADKGRVGITALAVLAILPQSVALSLDAIFVAIQKLQISAIALFISSVTTVLAGYYLVNLGFGTTGAVNALIIGQVVYAFILLLILYKKKALLFSEIDFLTIKKIIISSLPYGLLSVLGLLYFRIDTVMLSYLKGNFETGIYGAAYKFLEAASFIPTAFYMALFPVLSKNHTASPFDLKKIYFKSLKIMLILGLLVLFGYLVILPFVISFFLPAYSSSIVAINVLSLSIPFMFIHVPAVTLLLSSDKHLKTVIILSVLIVVINVVSNLLLIPSYGYLAASWVTVASEILSFIIFFIFIQKRYF